MQGLSLTINFYTFGGTNPTDFTQTNTCTRALAAAASCAISVVYKPAAAGSDSATLTVATTGGSVAATLSGTGVAAAKAAKPALVVLTSSANPMPASGRLRMRAAVRATSAALPTGTVQLKEGRDVLAEGVLSDGGATFQVEHMAPGVHMLYAEYLCDAKNPAASAATMRQVVTDAPVEDPMVPRLQVVPGLFH